MTCAERLTSLPGLIVTGHPDRNVARVSLGGRTAYLKREHRVRWRDRLRSAAAGFGFASLATREARTLAALRRAGVPCPDWMAFAEDNQGHGCVLLAELPATIDLRQYLRDRRARTPAARFRFARSLGAALAGVHAAGFDHPDLYAKHVLVAPATGQCYFLDWQRSRRRRLPWRRRLHDLAALDATLDAALATEPERLACVRGYLGASTPRHLAQQAAMAIRRMAQRLLRHRHIRKERASPPPLAGRGIVWLDGEALCVTQAFWHDLGEQMPDWLPLPARGHGSSRTQVALPGGRGGLLMRRWCDRPLAWLWCLLRRRPLLSPELREAGLLFRRQKHGLPAPRVLAFGQRRPRPWRTESFLLTEVDPEAAEGSP